MRLVPIPTKIPYSRDHKRQPKKVTVAGTRSISEKIKIKLVTKNLLLYVSFLFKKAGVGSLGNFLCSIGQFY